MEAALARHRSEARDDLAVALNAFGAVESSKGLAVLLATGSYNPAHLDHVGLVAQAKELLEQEGYHVVRALLSPSCDYYVKAKLGADAIPGEWRCRILSAAIGDLGVADVLVDTWESDQTAFWDHPDVGKSLRGYIAGRCRPEVLERTKLFYVSGADLYNGCCHRGHFNGVVVAGRKDDAEQALAHVSAHNIKQPDSPHYFLQTVPQNRSMPHLSSTLLRKHAKGDLDSARPLMGASSFEVFAEYVLGKKNRSR